MKSTTAQPKTRNRRSELFIVIIAYGIFVLLGIPEGMFGVAWPSMRGTFNLPLDALTALFFASAGAFLIAGVTCGRLVNRFGIGRLLILGNLVRGAAALGYVLAPTWSSMVLSGFFFGFGSGLIDAGMNTHFALNYNERLMNWLHASFGIGATIGPWLMTAIIFNANASWRWGYFLLALAQGVAALVILATLPGWRIKPTHIDQNESATDNDGGGNRGDDAADVEQRAHVSAQSKSTTVRETLVQPVVWLGMAIFLLIGGIEVTAGQWSFSLFTEGRGIDPKTAGFWVGIYWGSFTVGRIIFGALVGRWSSRSILRWMMGLAIVASALLWWNPAEWVSFGALAALGLALAPLFPMLTSATDQRMERRYAIHAVGYQVGAASLGIALLPSLTGILAVRAGLEVVGPILVISSIVMFFLHEMLIWQGEKTRGRKVSGQQSSRQ